MRVEGLGYFGIQGLGFRLKGVGHARIRLSGRGGLGFGVAESLRLRALAGVESTWSWNSGKPRHNLPKLPQHATLCLVYLSL